MGAQVGGFLSVTKSLSFILWTMENHKIYAENKYDDKAYNLGEKEL